VSDIVWEDPPTGRAKPAKWASFAAELKQHPGKWAIAKSGASYDGLVSTQSMRLQYLGCETAKRKQPDGTYTLYARWPEDAS
jgi:hypothetical protein